MIASQTLIDIGYNPKQIKRFRQRLLLGTKFQQKIKEKNKDKD